MSLVITYKVSVRCDKCSRELPIGEWQTKPSLRAISRQTSLKGWHSAKRGTTETGHTCPNCVNALAIQGTGPNSENFEKK